MGPKPASKSSKLMTDIAAIPWTIFAIFLSIPFFAVVLPLNLIHYLLVVALKRFRPDLGEIITGNTSVFTGDYFAKTPPRSNVVITMIFEGSLTYAKVKQRVQDSWILARNPETGKLLYEKFMQHPVRWMGFSFWTKTTKDFWVNKHVIKSRDFSHPVSKEDLNSIVESLVNTRIHQGKSPWEVHVIENYEPSPLQQKGVILIKIHHCLTDGAGLFAAVESLFGLNPGSGIRKPYKFPKSTKSWWESAVETLYTLANVFYLLTYHFKSSPWRVPDSQKSWRHVCAKSDPVLVGRIKGIKNRARVNFSSVVLSAASSAAERIIESSGGTLRENDAMLVMNIVPRQDRFAYNTILMNHYTAVFLEVPVQTNLKAEERLQVVHARLTGIRRSIFPLIFQCTMNLIGHLNNSFVAFASRNRSVSMGFTNFAGIPTSVPFDKNIKLLHADSVLGCFTGEAGVCLSLLGNESEVSIQISCEESIMSRTEAQQYVDYIVEEIGVLENRMKQIDE